MPLRLPGIAVGLLSIALTVSIQAGQQPRPQPQPNPSPSPPGSAGQERSPNLFGDLFKPSAGLAPLPGAATGTPRVGCGMTLVPVNPRFDARIRAAAPQKPLPSTRSVQTPRCR